jgi:endonuclease/exonuclease/phosphatase (EEP) superfamily protein YafD
LFVSSLYLAVVLIYFALRLVLGDTLWWIALINAFTVYVFTPLFVLIPVNVLAGLWRSAARLSLLALVGVIWFGPFFQPGAQRSASGNVLRLVSFNMWQTDEVIEPTEAWLREVNADIVLLQEAPWPYRNTDAPEDLLDLYPYQELHGMQLTLSRYPIVQSDPVPGNQTRLVLDIDGREVALYNVHFRVPFTNQTRLIPDASSHVLNLMLNYDETARNAQIREFLEYVETEELPHIVAGDFNTSQHSLIYADIALQLRDAFREVGSGLGATWPVGQLPEFVPPLLRIDYIWYSGTIRPIDVELGPDLGSDHLPLVALLELVTPRPPEETPVP